MLEDYRMRKLRDVKHVEWRLNAHVTPVLGNLIASKFGSAQVKRDIDLRRDGGASDTTINRELAIVRRGFALGYREDPSCISRT